MKRFLGFVAAVSFFSFAKASDRVNFLDDVDGIRKIEVLGRCDAMPELSTAEMTVDVAKNKKKVHIGTPKCKDEMRLGIQRCVCSCHKNETATILHSKKDTDPVMLACLGIQ